MSTNGKKEFSTLATHHLTQQGGGGLLPPHGWQVGLFDGAGCTGGALTDPAVVRQQRDLLFHLVQDLLPLHVGLRRGLLTPAVTHGSAVHCSRGGGTKSTLGCATQTQNRTVGGIK